MGSTSTFGSIPIFYFCFSFNWTYTLNTCTCKDMTRCSQSMSSRLSTSIKRDSRMPDHQWRTKCKRPGPNWTFNMTFTRLLIINTISMKTQLEMEIFSLSAFLLWLFKSWLSFSDLRKFMITSQRLPLEIHTWTVWDLHAHSSCIFNFTQSLKSPFLWLDTAFTTLKTSKPKWQSQWSFACSRSPVPSLPPSEVLTWFVRLRHAASAWSSSWECLLLPILTI